MKAFKAKQLGLIESFRELRRTGFVIPSKTFCATAGLWSGHNLQVGITNADLR